MDFIIQSFAVLLMLGILSILIVVHECGHFLVARMFGFQTPIFGFGLPFGPHITLGKAWDTEFRIYACLLGGFVLIPELGDESTLDPAIYSTAAPGKNVDGAESGPEESDKEESATEQSEPQKSEQPDNAFGVKLKPFKKFPIWQRALVAVAGVTFNVLFAYLIMLFMLVALGDAHHKVMVRDTIDPTTIASRAGIKADDMIVGIDDLKVSGTADTIHYLKSNPATEMVFHVIRQGEPVDIKLTTSSQGTVGMKLEDEGTEYKKLDASLPELLGIAWQKLYDLTGNMVSALGQLAQGFWNNVTGAKKVAGTPNVGIGDVHGVLAVIKIGADIARQDWNQLFIFTILISMDLAIINLMPYPALDGGHLAFMTIELIRGRPMGERAHGEIIKWGFISLLFLMAVIMVNDISALMTGKLDLKKKDQIEKKIDKEAK
ncbi:MAG: site-2 protease family protein [Candidatus Melainabacteria bacterium]|nr:site-2 protease family protein [Candidatus Melainabacteria bacterium]